MAVAGFDRRENGGDNVSLGGLPGAKIQMEELKLFTIK